MKTRLANYAQLVIFFCHFGQLPCEISNHIPTSAETRSTSPNIAFNSGPSGGTRRDDLSVSNNLIVTNDQDKEIYRAPIRGQKTVVKKPIFISKRTRIGSKAHKHSKIADSASTLADLPLKAATSSIPSMALSDNSEHILESTTTPTATMPTVLLTQQTKGWINDDNTPLTVNEDLCPPQLKLGDVKWRKGSRVVASYLPSAIKTDCTTNCNAPKIVHHSISIQEGDAIKMMMNPQDSNAPLILPKSSGVLQQNNKALLSLTSTTLVPSTLSTTSVVETIKNKEFSKEILVEDPIIYPDMMVGDVAKKGDTWQISLSSKDNEHSRGLPVVNPKIYKKNRTLDVTKRGIRKLKDNVENQDIISSSAVDPKNSLIIWQVTEKEWQSCSTREGGQIANSGESGSATIKSSYLIPGTTYLIGRSSWSSSECFKMKVTVKPADCGDGSICSGKGVCFANSTMNKYDCLCCHGYIGFHCEERDACSKKPCQNAGICIDIPEGHDGSSFQCICAYGFKGQYCDQFSSLCTSNPCINGGTCVGNHTSFSCLCPSGWNGPQCQNISEEVEPSFTTPNSVMKGACTDGKCVHGVCVQTSNTEFRCFCQNGYGGNKCQIEYNECFSQPCLHGGTCMDNVGYFQCICEPGFSGQFCQVKEDICKPNPCPGNLICVQGKNSYTCECSPTLDHGGCSSSDDNLCTPNPCSNGGTCFIVAEVMMNYCVCRPGFTGTSCKGITHSRKSTSSEYPYQSRSKSHNRDTSILESVGTYGTLEPVEAIDPPVFPSNGHKRMKSFYTVAIMLSCAFLIFLLVFIICHLKLSGTMCRCLIPSLRGTFTPSFSRMQMTTSRDKRRKRLGSLRLDFDDGASVPMTPQDRSETVYCNVDVCDHQDIPLMKQ